MRLMKQYDCDYSVNLSDVSIFEQNSEERTLISFVGVVQRIKLLS